MYICLVRESCRESMRVFSVISRRHFCYGAGFDSSEFVEESVNVNHSICIFICSSGCEFKQAFIDSSLSSNTNNEGPHLMINLCTCSTGGSTSTIRSSKRRGGTTVSCKKCGGRPAIDEKRSSSCLLNTVLELTSLINSDFTWTKVSKGCRSSSRRPRTSNTISLSCGELLSKDSQGLEMPVSESEKLGVSVLGCHFSEKAEHIPIKKRRFLFRASSPPRNTVNPPLEDSERHETSSKSSNHGLQFNSNASSLPAASEPVTGLCKIGSNSDKLDDFSGISILAAAACSNSLGAEADRCEGSVTKSPEVTKIVNENSVKNEEPNSHTSTAPFQGDESTLNNTSSQTPMELTASKLNEESSIQKSPAEDVRFSWDLNTVMDAWEEPVVTDPEIPASEVAHENGTFVEKKKNECTLDNSVSESKSISNQSLPAGLKSLGHENAELKLGKCEPLSREFDSSQHVVVVKTESLHDKHIDSANDVIPVTRTLSLENPTYGIFSKWAKSSDGLCSTSTKAVDTKLCMDCSVPPGFGVSSTTVAAGESVKSPTTITQTVSQYEKPELSLRTSISLENGAHQSGVIYYKVDYEQTDKDKGDSSMIVEHKPGAVSIMHNADNGFGYDNSQNDNRAGSGINKLDDLSVGYDSQYEDGELRESGINAWKGYELIEGGNENGMKNRGDGLNLDIVDAHETSSQNGPEDTMNLIGKEADLVPSVVLPEKLHSSDEVLSGSGQNEMIGDRDNSEKHDTVVQNVSQSDEWKMNISGWDILPENQRILSTNFTKTRNFSSRKFSYREEEKDEFDTEDVEMKGEGSRFYRKESLTGIGAPSTRDAFVNSNRGRFRMQGCSSKVSDGLTTRPERESGGLRSFGRGRYYPHNRPSGRGGGMWNRSPERGRDLKRVPSPSYHGPSFIRSMQGNSGTVDNMKNEGGMDPCDTNRPNNTSSYVTRSQYRSRSPMNREANDYRAHLGSRPTRDTGHDRFVNMGRGRGGGRYNTRLDGEGPRGRYHGPVSDDCDDEFLPEYSHPFPRRRRCFSLIERRGNNSYQHHKSDSRSPSRPRTRSPIANSGFRRRSRSPNFRPDTRIRRPRSPSYRDHPLEYNNSGPRNNNSSPPSSRWVNYKERPVFDRRSPPPRRIDGPFYDSSRKPKQNEYYRSGHPGRFSDLNEGGGRGRPRNVSNDGDQPNNGYRRRGFVRRFNMDGPTKCFHYDDEDGFGRGFDARDKHALELHSRSNANPNSKPCSNGTDSRFRDFPRRVRDDSGEFKRRPREGKDPKEESEQHIVDDFERRPKEVKDKSTTTTTTTNLDSMMPNEVVKDGENKPILGSN